MTDYELHREEFIRERAGMILDSNPGMSVEEADSCAKDIWNAMQELAKTAQEAAK
jgi:hypothetical protein